MPKNDKLKKILVIGSGPIVIGQAAEFDYAGTQACQALKEEGVEVVLEMSGHPAAIRDGFEAAANAGRVSLLGIPTKEVSLDLSRHIIFKGLRVEGITGRKMYDTWYQMKGLLERGRIDLTPLITHRMKLEQFEEAFELMTSGKCGKIVFLHE